MAGPAQTRYLLDTNICIYIAKGQPQAVRERMAGYTLDQLAMSMVTLGELQFGAQKSQYRDRALDTIAQLAQLIPVFALPVAAAAHYGLVRAALQRRGEPIGNNDLWLAAHALAEGWTLVTHNTREFVRVPGLAIENWAA